jgi:hypothetical protein
VVTTHTEGNQIGQRPTHVGQMRTQSGIDELPQLINVLRGEMLIFGRRNVYRWPGPHIVLPARASLINSANAKMIEPFIGRMAVNFAKLPELKGLKDI